jgi:hypothetical protein
MNREILFRGLRADGKGWVYGCPGYGFSQSIEYIMPKMYFATRDFGEEDENENPILEDVLAIGGFIPVIHKSVGQFTGLTDHETPCSNVHEGDFIENCDTKELQVVYWNEDKAAWYCRYVSDPTHIVSLADSIGNLNRVVGNIHEGGEE